MSTSTTHKLKFHYNQRLAFEHLGRRKYTTSAAALVELVANALDARARQVDVRIEVGPLGRVESVIVEDNGDGMLPSTLMERFQEVGVVSDQAVASNSRLGRFGIGRLAVFRIGEFSRWTTIAADPNNGLVQCDFELRPTSDGEFDVYESRLETPAKTGTVVEIHGISDDDQTSLQPRYVSKTLTTQFCSYLLTRPSVRLRVNDEPVDVRQAVVSEEKQLIEGPDLPAPVSISHLLLSGSVSASKFPDNIIYSCAGRTVHAQRWDGAPLPTYVALIESDYFRELVTSNRESISVLDPGFQKIANAALQATSQYGDRLTASMKKTFIEKARRQPHYPYRRGPTNALEGAEQQLYDVVLEKVHEHANLETLSVRQQSVVFKLIKRAIENQDLMEVLGDVAALSDDELAKFNNVLQRTTLSSLIRLSSEVTARLAFLDVLHEMVYGDVARYLQERTQLHKILEQNCWLFGEKYHLATSDQSFRTIIRRHREKAKLSPVSDDDIANVDGVDKIPDLFLASTRRLPVKPQNHHVVVEIKAPRVPIGPKEVTQIEGYGSTILASPEFNKDNTIWDLFLVSARAKDEIQYKRNQADRTKGVIAQYPGMVIWALEWSEIIDNARAELELVQQHLQRKSEALGVTEYLREAFPEILADLEQRRSCAEPSSQPDIAAVPASTGAALHSEESDSASTTGS